LTAERSGSTSASLLQLPVGHETVAQGRKFERRNCKGSRRSYRFVKPALYARTNSPNTS
jgi:hypothetical protein